MKRTILLTALALAFAGCRNEAEKLGYRGADTADDDQLYFSVGPTVTNWVPARVLMVSEQYEFSADETALVAAAGVVASGEDLKEIPAGYVKRDVEPWFVSWVRDAECFGKKGVCGFVSHFDEDRGVWQTGETFFSTYWDGGDAARAALADLEREIVEKFHPLKMHRFADCFVAEYRRLRVMALVGQKADGKWSCMLSLQDKNRTGCGPWEPVADQQERVEMVRRAKALKAWRAAKAEVAAKNHAKVEELRQAAKLPAFGEDVRWAETEDGRMMCGMDGQFDAEKVSGEDFFAAKVKEAGELVGQPFGGEPVVQNVDSNTVMRTATWKGALYEVRVDVATPPGQWRVLCAEVLQPGFAVPPRP